MDAWHESDVNALTFGNVNACSCETFPCYHDLFHKRLTQGNAMPKMTDPGLIQESVSDVVVKSNCDKSDNPSIVIKGTPMLEQGDNLTKFLNKEHDLIAKDNVILEKRETLKYLPSVIARQNSLIGFNFDNTNEFRNEYARQREKNLKHCQFSVRQVQKQKLDSTLKSKAKKKKEKSNESDSYSESDQSSSSESNTSDSSSDSSSESSDSSDSSDSSSTMSSSSSSESDSSSDDSDEDEDDEDGGNGKKRASKKQKK